MQSESVFRAQEQEKGIYKAEVNRDTLPRSQNEDRNRKI